MIKLIILFLELREPIIYEESFVVFNNFQPVASKSDRKFGTYQFDYFGTARRTCKNTRGAKILSVICLIQAHLSENMINLQFDLKYSILIGGFLITFTWWSVAICGSTRNCVTCTV